MECLLFLILVNSSPSVNPPLVSPADIIRHFQLMECWSFGSFQIVINYQTTPPKNIWMNEVIVMFFSSFKYWHSLRKSLDNPILQRRIVNIVGPDLCSNLQSLSHRRNVASLSLFYKYFHGCCSDELKSLTPALKSFKRVTRFSASAHPFTLQLPSCNKHFYSTSFFPHTSDLWNSLPSSCFPPSYDLQIFKCNVHHHLSSC